MGMKTYRISYQDTHGNENFHEQPPEVTIRQIHLVKTGHVPISLMGSLKVAVQ